MPKRSLTEARVKMLKPRKTVRDIRDGKLKGFGVRVLPSGKKRFFIHCQYGGERIWKIFGSAGTMTVGEARLRAVEMLASIRRGEGLPVEPEDTLFETVAEIAFRRFERVWKARTLAVNRNYLKNQLLPYFAGRQIDKINRQDVSDWFASLSATPVSANRSMPVLSVIMREAERVGLRPRDSNPCRGRQQGKAYAGRDPERCRQADRAGDRRRRRERCDAGLCTSCGRRRPEDDRSVCERCREAKRALDRRRYSARRAAGCCVRCSQTTVGGLSRCGRCLALEKERVSPERDSAVSRKRYAARRSRGECVDCKAPAGGAARCPRCAYRSNSRAPERHLVSMWPPQIAVIELETGDELGVFETESEAAACIAFARLRPDQVEIRANVPLMALPPA